MTEPVAYLVSQEPLSSVRWLSDVKPIGVDDKQITPLYTAEQLHPRVKMTQAEFDELNSIPESASVYGAMVALYSSNIIKHLKLINRFSGNDGQIEFANLWFDYRINNKSQEATIEIIPDMKWFVRSIVVDDGYYYYLLKNNNDPMLDYEPSKKPYKEYMNFDTKEEAELWTNPLTEAVQLPVEDE